MSIPSNISPLGVHYTLPAVYTRLEFLESSNGQRIYIKKPFDTATDFRWSIKLQTTVSSGWGHAFGVRSSAGAFGCAYDNNGKKLELNYLQTGGAYTPDDLSVPLLVESDLRGIRVNGLDTNIASVYTPLSFSTIGVFCKEGIYYNFFTGRIWCASLFNSGKTIFNLLPVLDSAGTPCMFDLVSREPFYYSGTVKFIAGVMDTAHLRTVLRKLPATGGALTLSLPAEANTPEVAEALQACHDTKGWTLTVHEYRPAAAATYSLRRVRSVVWCRKERAEHGSYVDSTGTRWQVERCAAIFGALGQNPTAYGYEPFDSVDAATAYWEITPYVETVEPI